MAICVTISNFIRIPHLRLAPTKPVVLLAGPNEAGKSSFAEALRILFLDETPRVKYKKDRSDLVHGGAKSGSVMFESGNLSLVRFIKDGKVQGDGGLLPSDQTVAAICLQSKFLASMDDAERRAVLMQLSKMDLSVDSIATKLIEKGIDKDVVVKLRPLLKGGLKPAHEKSKREAQDAKGAWREITGEVYGSQKAEGWQPENPVIEAGAAAQSLVDIDAQIAETKAARETAIDIAVSEINAKIAELRKEKETALEPVVANIRNYNDQLSKPTPLACPHCGGVVTYQNGELKQADSTDKAQLQKMLTIANGKRKELADSYDAKINQLTKDEATAKKSVNDDFDTMMRGLNDDKNALTAQIEASEKAQHSKGRAADLHKSAQAYDQLAKLLSEGDDGVAAEMISASLKPLNERLMELGLMIGWTPAAIHSDMSIVRTDGYSYSLLSESAKWRIDAMLHILVSELSGYDLLVLDRMDVLHASDRPAFLRWINDYATMRPNLHTFIMATLKQPPDLKALESIDTHWIEDGRLS